MASTLKDARGHPVSGGNTRSLEIYEQAMQALQCYTGDPVALVDRAIEEGPDLVMAQVLRAYLVLSGMESRAVRSATKRLDVAGKLPANERERAHIAAARELAAGEYEEARELLEGILIDCPTDALAVQMAHLFDFYQGDSRNLRDRVARVLHAWSPSVPGYHAVLGMHAFGLEECAEYERAEAAGREALELQPRNGWAHHAVAHVMEMQGRRDDGVEWMRSRQPAWAEDSFLAVHNWWHWALFFLDQDELGQALQIYDGGIRQARSEGVLDVIDAAALLWRFLLRGVGVGSRWAELADAYGPRAEEAFYAFNDAHAMMALVGAERWDVADNLLAAQETRLESGGSNQMMTREVGLPVCRALYAFGREDYAATVQLLRPIRFTANRFGGSHAQRDVLDLTLMEAAARSRQFGLVRALASERIHAKPPAPLTLRYREKGEQAGRSGPRGRKPSAPDHRR